MLHPEKGTNTVRAVFIVDPKGKARLIMYYPQEIGRNMDEIVRVIVPPASSEAKAKERLQDDSLECFDWWFCHKPLEK